MSTSTAKGYAVPASSTPMNLADETIRTQEVVKGLKTLLWAHGASSHVIQDMAQQAFAYLEGDSPTEALWFKRIKYLLVLPMSVYLNNDLPKQPDQRALRWTGSFGSWCRNRLRLFKPKNTHLWYSWLQGKRCSLPLSADIVESTYRTHYESLTRPDPLTREAAQALIHSSRSFLDVLAMVRERLNETLRRKAESSGIGVGAQSLVRPASSHYSCSTSASFSSTRAKGGASNEIYASVFGSPLDHLRDSYLERMDYKFNMSSLSWDVVTRYGDWEAYELHRYAHRVNPLEFACLFDLRLAVDSIAGVHCNCSDIGPSHEYYCLSKYRVAGPADNYVQNRNDSWHNTLVYNEPRTGRLPAMIQAILEPLKVRVISKGPALEYYAVKSLQKALHQSLRSLAAFELIGRKLESSDLDRLRTFALPGHQWGSVDYSAATDGSSSNLGLSILAELCRDLPERDLLLANQVLGHHNLFYPENEDASEEEKAWRGGEGQSKGKLPVGSQTNGQLMGSPISFPILCLMNFLVYCLNHPDQTAGESLQRVLVNGDDMLYTCTEEEWRRHIQISASVGLVMSPGKAYLHPVYANANSTSFHCNLKSSEPARQIGYLNTGLMFGKHKVMADDREDRQSEPIQTVINVITGGCLPGDMQREVLRMLLRMYAKDLERETAFTVFERTQRGYRTRRAHRNLFLAQSAGGFGLDSCGLKYYVTNDQKLLAQTRLEEKMSRGGPHVTYLEDTAADDTPGDLAVEWRSQTWTPWVSSRPGGDSDVALWVDSCDYSTLRREWKNSCELYAKTGFFSLGTSRSCVWSC